jgi:NTE family protein
MLSPRGPTELNEPRVANQAAVKLSSAVLSSAHVFDKLAPTELEILVSNSDLCEFPRGDVLVHEGDPSDILYFVVSGRFCARNERTGDVFGEVGPGQPVGEIGFFSNIPRTATVTALRDSQVLAISRERFERIGRESPGIWNAVATTLSDRLARRNRYQDELTPPRTISIIMAGDSGSSSRFVELLRDVFGAGSRSLFITEQSVRDRFPGYSLDDPSASRWLNSCETEAEFVFYVAEPDLTDWTRKCIRQSDLVLLVAAAGSGAGLNPSERFAFSLLPPSARRLVVLHDARCEAVSGTSAWLDERDVFMHHHVALSDADDVERLRRFITGRAVGFVAGGGGSLGSAHVGVYKAFNEAGTNFDIFGGTSVGAAMAAALAICGDPEKVDRGTGNIFVKNRAFRSLTLPYLSILNHRTLDRALREEYGDVLIEDLWRPFFAVSTNLSQHKTLVHRRGPVWQAVRASSAVPGVLPPFYTADGEMLVDGGLLENVPLSAMKSLKIGPNVVVALRKPEYTTYDIDYDSIPGPLQWLHALLNPFRTRRLPRAPHMLEVVMLSMFANSRADLELGSTDTLIHPEIPSDLRWTKWERHTEVFMGAYQGVLDFIRARLAEADPAVTALVGIGRHGQVQVDSGSAVTVAA